MAEPNPGPEITAEELQENLNQHGVLLGQLGVVLQEQGEQIAQQQAQAGKPFPWVPSQLATCLCFPRGVHQSCDGGPRNGTLSPGARLPLGPSSRIAGMTFLLQI